VGTIDVTRAVKQEYAILPHTASVSGQCAK
jgi:hypothetical protein